jgi:hypothetical protein
MKDIYFTVAFILLWKCKNTYYIIKYFLQMSSYDINYMERSACGAQFFQIFNIVQYVIWGYLRYV